MMLKKSTSLWFTLCLTGLIVPISIVTNNVRVSATNDTVIAQANPCAGKNPCASKTSKNVGGPLAKELQGKPVVVDIYATWCPACKNIAPTLSQLKQQYNGKAHFVIFDVSDKTKAAQSEARAKQLGLADFFAKNKSQTGSVTIVNPKTGDILTQYRNNNKLNDYTSVLNTAISQK